MLEELQVLGVQVQEGQGLRALVRGRHAEVVEDALLQGVVLRVGVFIFNRAVRYQASWV